jgi:hypothetical protein
MKACWGYVGKSPCILSFETMLWKFYCLGKWLCYLLDRWIPQVARRKISVCFEVIAGCSLTKLPVTLLTIFNLFSHHIVAQMGEKRNAYRLLVGKPEEKRPLGRPRRKWVDNIRMDLLELGRGDVDWIGLAQDRDRWRALVNSVLNLRVP